MTRKPPRLLGLETVHLGWYPVALLPIALLVVAPILGWVPVVVLPIGLFFLFFWIFSLAFAIYAKLSKPKDRRQ